MSAPTETTTWFVYLLECRGGRVYTGISTDPEARLRQHRAGKGARFTRMHPPERLLAVRACASAQEARRDEYRIKQLSPADKRALAACWQPPATP